MSEVITDHLDLWTSALLTKSSAGRRSNGKQEAYGIKKLRELILELAVRGRLVPQDPSDEPALLLLKQAREEKERLVAAGEIKREKQTLAITGADEPFGLPNGWLFVRLGDLVLSIKSGGTPSKHNPAFWNGEVPWASVKDLGFGEPLSDTQDCITKSGLDAGSCLAEAGSILICTRMGLGKIGEALIDVAINQDLKAVKLAPCLDKQYFITYYKTMSITGTGMTVAGIRQDELLNFVVPLPPLAEQHRIVAKVDELMVLCDQLEQQQTHSLEAHQTLVETLLGTLTRVASQQELTEAWTPIASHFDTLFTTERSIDQLKQTILQLAVMGKLVPQDPNDEPASVLLEKIIKRREELIEEGRLKRQSPTADITEDERLFVLPAGWEFVRFGSVTFNRDAERVPLSVEERSGRRGEYDYYGASGVIDSINDFLFDKPLLLIGEDGANLINRSTPIAYMARGKYWVNNHAHVLDGLTEELLLYICLHINAISLGPYVTGTAQPKMNQAKMNSIVLALPPEEEQHRIVAKVDELMALCDALKARIKDAQTTQIRLADTIVEQAVA